MHGIRLRITAIAAVVVAAVLVITALVLVTTQRRTLTQNLDEALRNQSTSLEFDLANGAFETVQTLLPRGDDDAIAQVVVNGRVVAATPNFSAQLPLSGPPAGSVEQLHTTHLLTGQPRFRLLSRHAGDAVIHTAAPLDDVDESIAALRVGLAVTIPVVALIIAGLIWWLVGRTLKPVEAIRMEVADISGKNLHRRVPEPSSGDEIARLARTMNAMLDRVEESLVLQQRFVSDASHELRSPLTRIRSSMEVDIAHPDGADYAATHYTMLAEIEQLQLLIEDLLLLARGDAHVADQHRRETVDLDDIVLQEAQRLRESTNLAITRSDVSAAQVSGDRDALRRVIRNLADNAARHARSAVVFALVESDAWARLTVTDDGPGVAPEHRARVFERFARVDEARTPGYGGTGLGLAIVREIVDQHAGSVYIDDSHSAGARFVVLLPLAAG